MRGIVLAGGAGQGSLSNDLWSVKTIIANL